MNLLYDFCLHGYLLASLPKIFFHFGKYKNNLFKRLGRGFPTIEKRGRALFWIHAVSVGETKAVAALIKRLKSLENPPCIVLSTSTETGHEAGKKSVPEADYHVFMPLDLSYIIRPIVKKVAPDCVIVTETDFWHHFQDAAKKTGAKLIVINGKLSERSFNRYLKFPFLKKLLLKQIDHFYLQGELYKSRFERLNIDPSRLTVSGNIKIDSVFEKEDEDLKQRLKIKNEPVLVLGSTHSPEEQLWILALKNLWKVFPDLKVLIVPRHPERFNEVAKLLESHSIPYSRWTQQGTLIPHVLLVDTMGALKKCYSIATLAFVGGSFTPKIGGHNILEPALYGKPVLFGPYMHSQPDFLDLVHSYNAGIQITSNTLTTTVEKLLSSPSTLQTLGQNGKRLIEESHGALELTFKAISSTLCLHQKKGSW